jgi:alkanesulfonate monooxygenase SsuD/methylene tetrahydromethanopterin reductase-like flavin-dependent oxidoreductase (luciferase family)
MREEPMSLTFGALLPSRPSYLRLIPELERLGFSETWFPDFQLAGADPFVTMARQAALTERMRFGVGVCNPVTRHVTVVANVMASLNREFPGRVGLGLGAGASPLKALGLKPAKLAEMATYVEQCRSLMAGEPAEMSEAAGAVQFLQFWRDALEGLPPVPIRIAAGGPKALTQAGRIADDVIIGTVDEKLLELQISYVRQGAREAGRDPESVGIAVMSTIYLQSETPTVEELRAHVGGYVPNMLVSNGAVLRANPDSGVDPELVSAFELAEQAQSRLLAEARERGGKSAAFERYMESFPDAYDALVNLTTMRAKGLFGDRAEIRQRLDALSALGVTKVILYPDPQDETALASFAQRFIAD